MIGYARIGELNAVYLLLKIGFKNMSINTGENFRYWQFFMWAAKLLMYLFSYLHLFVSSPIFQ